MTTFISGTRVLKMEPSIYSLVPRVSKPISFLPIMNFAGTVIFAPCQGASSSQFLRHDIVNKSQVMHCCYEQKDMRRK